MSKTAHKPWYSPVAHFAAHSAVGTVIFVIILLPAVGLNYLIHFLENLGGIPLSSFTLAVFSMLENAITLADATLYVIFLVFGIYRAAKEITE